MLVPLVVATLISMGIAAAWKARHRGVVMTSFEGPTHEHVVMAAIRDDLVLAPSDPGQSTRWLGYLHVQDADTYDFRVEGTGFYRLFVNEIPVVDVWDDYAHGEITGRALLSRGTHKLRLEHRQTGGGGNLHVSWTSSRFARRSLASALRH